MNEFKNKQADHNPLEIEKIDSLDMEAIMAQQKIEDYKN